MYTKSVKFDGKFRFINLSGDQEIKHALYFAQICRRQNRKF
ncbi:hypothetical protein [uncultured Campylobacter sp.]|nr:hypothetical protein [uncultured Campylobacter sp.]